MRYALQVGLTLRQGARTLELVRQLSDTSFLLEDVLTRRPVEYSLQKLVGEIQNKSLVVVAGNAPTPGASTAEIPVAVDIASLTPSERDQMEYRLRFVREMQRRRISRGQRGKVNQLIDEVCVAAASAKRPSSTTVMLWARKYETSGMNALALVDRHRLRASCGRLSEEVGLLETIGYECQRVGQGPARFRIADQ